MFKVGELIKRKTLSDGRARAVCVVVDKNESNYTVYNHSLKCIQTVACVVVNELYSRVA
jgi:L-lactate utilization protein LutB